MIRPEIFAQHVGGEVPFFAGVPDSLLKHLSTHLEATLPDTQHVIAANEGAAVGVAIGHHLRTGGVPVVYLQNSGIGNAVNPLLSLADSEVYGIPIALVIGWRGRPGMKDEPQHVKQGRVMAPLLDAMEIPYALLPHDEDEALAQIAEIRELAVTRSAPAALLVEADTFSAPEAAAPTAQLAEGLPSREKALITFADAVGEAAVVVCTTGMLGRELFEHRAADTRFTARDFLSVGGMGHASSIAQGIALADPAAEIWTFDGDGALLMHLGTLAVIAKSNPANFFHVIFNNGVHDSVGGQPTAIGNVDVRALAVASGYRDAVRIRDCAEIPGAVKRARSAGGPFLIECQVRPGNRSGIGRPTRTPQQSKDAFMRALQSGN